MASLSDNLKGKLKGMLNKEESKVATKLDKIAASKVNGIVGNGLGGILGGTLGGLLGSDSTSKNKSSVSTDKKYICKYQVKHFIIMNGDDKIEMDHSNILSIEYMNDYEFNIMALLKVSLRVDIRKKMWILKNKKDILVKFELGKVGRDTDNEVYTTAAEDVWNLEFGVYFNDEDEAIDVGAMESRINLNEGKDFQSNDKEGENYFESQNTLDVYLVLPELLKASRNSFNKVYTKTTLQNALGHMLTQSGHKHVLMSKLENDEVYKELLLPVNPVYKNLVYLDQYYGLYKKGAIIYYDLDCLYILNANGKLTVNRPNEWTETTILVSKIADSTPGNGMIRKEGEKIFYPSISDGDINPQNFAVSKNAGLGSSAKIVVTDTTDVEVHDADQTVTNQRNENVTFIKDKNKFTGDVVKARMEENECVLYLSGNNLDINAFTPNKIFKVVFDETSKQKAYGNYTYRLAYSYHFLKLESEGYMSSSHRAILKRSPSTKEAEKTSNSSSSTLPSPSLNPLSSIGKTLGNIEGTIKGEIGNFENRLKGALNSVTSTVTSKINTTIKAEEKKITNKMSKAVGDTLDKYKLELKSKIKK